jgi:integrase/recombinase XerD
MARKKIELKSTCEAKRFDEGYDEFILNCKVRNLRPTTIKYYDDMVHIWYLFFTDYRKPINEITRDTIDKFILFIREKMNMNDVTINTVVRGIRSILYYFMKLGYMEEFKIPKLKEDREVIQTYSDDELKLLLKKPNIKECTYLEYRNYVIVNVFLATGMRARTLVNLKLKDLDFHNGLISYGYTKNRKPNLIPMSNSLKQVLMEYLTYRKIGEEDFVFVNAYGNELTVDQLGHNLNTYNRNRGVNTTGVHRFRHSFSKAWILAGGDIFKLQRILGHSTLDMVKNYVNMFSNDLQKDFDKFNPLERIQNNNRSKIKLK